MALRALDQEIIDSKAGNEGSFRRVMEHYQSYAYRFAFRMLCDEADARDAVQESFIRIWKSFPRYDQMRPFATWMYAIVSNVCLDHLRVRRRRSSIFAGENEEFAEPGQLPADEQFSNRQLASIVRGMTRRLSPRQKLVFTLRDLEDLPVEEVVEITGMSAETIKANLWHARRAVREMLMKEYNVEGGRT